MRKYNGKGLDIVSIYLREARGRLLTRQEEMELAQRIARGDQQARHELITSNLGLVVAIARRYAKGRLYLLPDLIQEGNMGLLKAAAKFDRELGFRFATYAGTCIRRCIQDFLRECKTIRIPQAMALKIVKHNKAVSRLAVALSREPTPDEIACELGMAVKHVHRIRKAARGVTSPETLISEDAEEHLVEILQAAQEPDSLRASEERDRARKALAGLTHREQIVLSMRFGLKNGAACTLKKTGRRLRVTRERARQIQNEALEKLRLKIK